MRLRCSMLDCWWYIIWLTSIPHKVCGFVLPLLLLLSSSASILKWRRCLLDRHSSSSHHHQPWCCFCAIEFEIPLFNVDDNGDVGAMGNPVITWLCGMQIAGLNSIQDAVNPRMEGKKIFWEMKINHIRSWHNR